MTNFLLWLQSLSKICLLQLLGKVCSLWLWVQWSVWGNVLQCAVRAARSNVLQASLVFTTILVIIVYVCVCICTCICICESSRARGNFLQASSVLFGLFWSSGSWFVYMCVCVFVIVFVFVRAARHVAMYYKPLYDHIGHTQRPHISPLSFLKLHCTLLSLIGHKKQG